MKTKQLVLALIAAALLGAGAYGIYKLGMSSGMKMSGSAPGGAAAGGTGAPDAGKKVLYWHDPMVPAQKFDKPGKSPFMDMMLVPVYADSGAGEGSVSISSRVQQNLGVRTAEATRGPVGSAFEAVGSVAYNERDVAVVQARANGFVEKLYARAPLDAVRSGQALAELLVPEWVGAQEEYLAVKRMTGDGLEPLREGALQRMRLAGMSDAQVRLVESSGKAQPRITVTAPIAGVISELTAREGMTVMAGAPMFRINGLGTVWVNAEIPESLAASIRPGIEVEARAAALPDAVLKGKVGAILPEVNAATRTLKARVELANPGGRLVPGMFATIRFAPASRGDGVLVPTEAVIQTGKRTVVVVADTAQDGKQAFAPVDVEIGGEANGMTEIRKGIAAGTKVVISGQFLIDSEASLKSTGTRLSDAPASNEKAHSGEGKVEKLGKDSVTLSHGPIASMQWGSMTMDFKLPRGGVPQGLKEGGQVKFEFRPNSKGEFEITTIEPMPPGAMTQDGAKR